MLCLFSSLDDFEFVLINNKHYVDLSPQRWRFFHANIYSEIGVRMQKKIENVRLLVLIMIDVLVIVLWIIE